jgi:uncharacterized protein YndB with AHSA1/START domain
MLKFILIGLGAVVVIFLVVAATRPTDFRVSRTATIAAPPVAVFEQVNNLRNWNAWSPWAKLDPTARNTFEGPAAGVGASFAWAGNSQVGEGKMTITESKPGELVVMKLEFIRPFAATNTTEFTFRPEGNGTTVSWSMAGKNNFLSKCVGLVMNCEKMVGSQFEEGFANLKAIVEPVPAT